MNPELQRLEAKARQFVLAAEKAVHYAQSGKLRVLLVEDSPWDVELFAHMLDNVPTKYEIETVRTPEAAVRLIKEHRHDVVVLDWHLGKGELTGLEIVEKLHAEGVFFPFVIWSCYNEDYVEAARKNCLAWVDKSHVTPESLDADLLLAFKSHFQQQCG